MSNKTSLVPKNLTRELSEIFVLSQIKQELDSQFHYTSFSLLFRTLPHIHCSENYTTSFPGQSPNQLATMKAV